MMRVPVLVLALLLLWPVGSAPGEATPGSAVAPAPAFRGGLHAQIPSGPSSALALRLPGGREGSLPIFRHRGYPAVAAAQLRSLGWDVIPGSDRVQVRHRTGIHLTFREGSPWLLWEDELLQMAHEVYAFGDDLLLPLQFVVDLLPGMLPAAYRFDLRSQTLYVEGAVSEAPSGGAMRTGFTSMAGAGVAAPDPPLSGPPPSPPGERAPRSRVVVIDPGHGGDEPGAVGPGGTMEKSIALAVGLALARELARDPWIEVYLTRDRDVAVPIWGRGEQATAWKGDRPGVFVSIHANAVPDRPSVRGFETYFLSEARTEHERRVAAAENAPLRRENPDAPMAGLDDPLLAGILRDLITFDHQHWSALLAEKVQRELATFHPGPDRGVKQGPFAVITNALMPSVLVELGFITNREEERLMSSPEFHRQSAAALARSIRTFFDRYPPGGTH
jgi:N-acetylmuramoyl-L-alanine amidase